MFGGRLCGKFETYEMNSLLFGDDGLFKYKNPRIIVPTSPTIFRYLSDKINPANQGKT